MAWRYCLFLISVLALLGCARRNEKGVSKNNINKQYLKQTKDRKTTEFLQETFVDSLNIGVKGIYKLEFKQFRNDSGVFVKFQLFAKQRGKWIRKQGYEAEKDGVTQCDVSVSDFNNDGLNDVTYQSAVAARGANELKKLLLFDKNTGTLILIKNSDGYPNLLYNKQLNCIDALSVTGSYTTVFLHIQKDSLAEFASVDIRDSKLSVTVTDKFGKIKYLVTDKKNKWGPFTRFKNFNPVEAYPDDL